MSTCLIFVFASLLEFAVVNVMLRQSDKLVKSASSGVDLYGTGSMSSQHLHQHQQHQQRLRRRAGGGAPGSAYCQSHASKTRRKSCCVTGSDDDTTSAVNIEVQVAIYEMLVTRAPPFFNAPRNPNQILARFPINPNSASLNNIVI